MPRVPKREVLKDRQDTAQPALFDDSQMPVAAAALESIRQRRYEHTGARLLDDDVQALRLVELLTLKWGVKKISREMNISTHSVRAARRMLVAQGKLAPYKQRVVEMMEDAIEAGVERYRDALETGIIPAAQIPIGVAIMFDKRALAMGEPTSISGGAAASSDLRVEDLNRYLENLPSCATVDSQSTVTPQKPQQMQGFIALDAALDAGAAQPNAPVPLPVHAAGPTPADAQARNGGGGGLDPDAAP